MARPVAFARGPVRGWVQYTAWDWGLSFALMLQPAADVPTHLCFDLLLIHWRVHAHVWFAR